MRLSADDAYKIRKVYRLTIEDMAKLCGVSQGIISMIENKERNFSERIQRRLIAKFDLTPEKLAEILEIYDKYQFKKGSE